MIISYIRQIAPRCILPSFKALFPVAQNPQCRLTSTAAAAATTTLFCRWLRAEEFVNLDHEGLVLNPWAKSSNLSSSSLAAAVGANALSRSLCRRRRCRCCRCRRRWRWRQMSRKEDFRIFGLAQEDVLDCSRMTGRGKISLICHRRP
jgi:hypothetical protein